MVERIFGNSLWYLVQKSDVVTKIVLLILLVMSIVCWAIFFYKIIVMRVKRRQLKEAIEEMRSVDSFEGLITTASKFSNTLPGYFFAKTLLAIKRFAKTHALGATQLLTLHEYEFVREHMEQTTAELVAVEETYVPVLSMSVAVSPLLGLFGTIWGLIQAFVEIGQSQSADIATVAPGIAEALITTLAGLMVAIPAAVMFNIVVNRMREFERQTFVLTDLVASVLQRVSLQEKNSNAQ